MKAAALACADIQILFYEPEGLLLAVGLLPLDSDRREYLLLFQLSYLGHGEISVHVGFERCNGTGRTAPEFATVELHGTARGRLPSIWTTSAPVRDDRVNCRLIVWGEPDDEELLRGELVAEISGELPVLIASSRASVTSAELPSSRDQVTVEP